ncbi:MAG: hypothetical protein LBI29_00980, partial [Rickettsiales bacterium]|nr:hypothetical protein [Rickettsiales bacterium]
VFWSSEAIIYSSRFRKFVDLKEAFENGRAILEIAEKVSEDIDEPRGFPKAVVNGDKPLDSRDYVNFVNFDRDGYVSVLKGQELSLCPSMKVEL